MSFTLLNKTYEDLYSLAGEMYLDVFSMAKEIRTSEFFDIVFKEDSKKAERISSLTNESMPDEVLVYRIGEILSPFQAFRYNGLLFENYQQLGRTMLASSPNTNSHLSSLVRFGLVSDHMESTGYSQSHKDLYAKIKEIELNANEDLTYAYFSLGFALYGKTSIIYDHKEYKDIYNLTYYLVKKEKDLASLGSYLSISPLLKAYAKYSPKGKDIEDYLHLCRALYQSEQNLDAFIHRKEEKE